MKVRFLFGNLNPSFWRNFTYAQEILELDLLKGREGVG